MYVCLWKFIKILIYDKLLHQVDKMLTCPKCQEKLKNKNSYINHLDGHSTTSKKHYPCPIQVCGIPFHNRKSFYEHMESHRGGEIKHSEADDKILCRHCNERFRTIADIETHLRTLPNHINIPCPFCKTKRSSYKAYKMHIIRCVQINFLPLSFAVCINKWNFYMG